MMVKTKRILAMLMAVAIFAVMLSSAFFLAEEAHHDCVGEDCPICFQISVCRSTLKGLCLAVCAGVLAAAFTYAPRGDVSARVDYAQSYTLVSLKVKLSN